MAEAPDSPRRSSGPRSGAGSRKSAPGSGRPSNSRPATDRPSTGRSASGQPRSDRTTGKHDRSSGNPFPSRSDRGGRDREIEDRDPYGVKSVRNRHDDPSIPDDVQPKDLDRVARTQLKSLSKENGDEVARHLAMAARLIEDDPALAHRHAVSAARRAGRIAVVRETLAITAYSTGDYALALRELRTYRRISGRDDQLPMMVDSERGLGRPDRALELGRSVPRAELPVEVRVELAIAMSGARLDLGQADLALGELEIPQLDPDRAYSYSPALFDAYAAVLDELGRDDDAEAWWERADRARHALQVAENGGEEDVVEIVEEEIPEGEILEEEILEGETPEEEDPSEGRLEDDSDDEPVVEAAAAVEVGEQTASAAVKADR